MINQISILYYGADNKFAQQIVTNFKYAICIGNKNCLVQPWQLSNCLFVP